MPGRSVPPALCRNGSKAGSSDGPVAAGWTGVFWRQLQNETENTLFFFLAPLKRLFINEKRNK